MRKIEDVLKEIGVRYEFDEYVPCYYIEPRWRVTTDRGAHIWGTWDCEKKADEGYRVAKRLGLPNISQTMMGLGIAELQDERFLIFHADDGLPIISGDIGDGETIRRLVEQSLKMDALEFDQWAGDYAEHYCQDKTLTRL
ncbi:hypothetical protein FRD01_13630 [Microvenator marinus]|uniref:Uncharacterized protein n=1 Tax=Microvenator marinus TaxID=2600177 RepID=A0A5B8XRT0_9DELT|nr:hypothetical protein [Microvenator marinus]QED28254.1 hypothetical protein FRD01_13630 [Microvenator marinus]